MTGGAGPAPAPERSVHAAVVLPEPALVLLIGPSGSGKSTFARRHFGPTEILSSDAFRALVSDDENDQSATRDAFELLHAVAERRLARRRLTVVDATNVEPESRWPLLQLARRLRAPAVALVLDLPAWLLRERNASRADRRLPPRVVARQAAALRRSLGLLANEGFSEVWVLGPEAIDAVVVERVRVPGEPIQARG